MRVLAIDTALPTPSLALLGDGSRGQAMVERVEDLPQGAAEALVQRLRVLLEAAGLAVRQIDRVAVLSGPGSFTGLRAGIAFARGLARALGVPLVAASTFRAACEALREPADVDLWLDAGRGEVFRARRRAGDIEEDPRPVPRPAAVAAAAGGGVAVRQLGVPPMPLAAALARLAVRDELAVFDASPLYGRPSAAEEKLAREATR